MSTCRTLLGLLAEHCGPSVVHDIMNRVTAVRSFRDGQERGVTFDRHMWLTLAVD
jgi:hypothetical protein